MTDHKHEFNGISGYCACGLQYVPYLHKAFPNGGIVETDTPTHFVTVLPEGSIVKEPTPMKWNE